MLFVGVSNSQFSYSLFILQFFHRLALAPVLSIASNYSRGFQTNLTPLPDRTHPNLFFLFLTIFFPPVLNLFLFIKLIANLSSRKFIYKHILESFDSKHKHFSVGHFLIVNLYQLFQLQSLSSQFRSESKHFG
jgi:hypothetical protein